jgi:hypothetical protein
MHDERTNPFEVLDQLPIPKTQNEIAFAFQHFVAYGVALVVSVFTMLAAVQFDHHARSVFGKIEVVASKWHLAAKVHAVVPEFAQAIPELSLHIGRVGAKLS